MKVSAKIDTAGINSSAPSKKGYLLLIPWTITYYSVFHPLTTFRYLYATMPPSTLSLVYFLDISLVGYCGTFTFQRTLGYLCLRKFSRHQSHQSNHHLRIFCIIS